MMVKNRVTGIKYDAESYGRQWHLKDETATIKNTITEDDFRRDYTVIMDEPSDHGNVGDIKKYRDRRDHSECVEAFKTHFGNWKIIYDDASLLFVNDGIFQARYEPIPEPSQDDNDWLEADEPSYLDKLRDEFAKAILMGIWVNPSSRFDPGQEYIDGIWRLADKVMVARPRKRGNHEG
jgi:hypothetical protein